MQTANKGLDAIYTELQQDIFKRCVNDDYFMLINHGAKRAGKTVLNNDLFLQELMLVRQTADKYKIDMPMYILSGATAGTIYQNVLLELTNKYGIEFNFDKRGNFTLFGVYVVTCGHSTIGHLNKIRGMTAHGAYINEGSLANPIVFDEIKSRCSGAGARILCDTNPDHPEHWLMKDYIKKAGDDSGIIQYQFTLDSNNFLEQRYKERIKASTPSGMLFERNINGNWVSGQGAIYSDFDKSKHAITRSYFDQNIKSRIKFYSASVDWGFALNHYGVIGVLAYDYDDNVYLVEEHAETLKEIDYWVEIGKSVKSRYGNILFTADSARPEHVTRFQREGLKTINADKAVIAGIESLSTLIKQGKFFVIYDECPRFREEIFVYAWDPNTGMPIKDMDDCMDMCRYNIRTLLTMKKFKIAV